MTGELVDRCLIESRGLSQNYRYSFAVAVLDAADARQKGLNPQANPGKRTCSLANWLVMNRVASGDEIAIRFPKSTEFLVVNSRYVTAVAMPVRVNCGVSILESARQIRMGVVVEVMRAQRAA